MNRTEADPGAFHEARLESEGEAAAYVDPERSSNWWRSAGVKVNESK